jgi:uncharacterized membrane protein
MRHDADFSEESAEASRPGIFARLRTAGEAARALAATRGAIFREEMSEQAAIFGRGAAAFAVALALAGMMVLLLTALIASLFALLFGSVWAGILATFVLYLAATAGAAYFGVKAFSKLRLDFPATQRGLSEDIATVRAAIAPLDVADAADAADLVERFREGAE